MEVLEPICRCKVDFASYHASGIDGSLFIIKKPDIQEGAPPRPAGPRMPQPPPGPPVIGAGRLDAPGRKPLIPEHLPEPFLRPVMSCARGEDVGNIVEHTVRGSCHLELPQNRRSLPLYSRNCCSDAIQCGYRITFLCVASGPHFTYKQVGRTLKWPCKRPGRLVD